MERAAGLLYADPNQLNLVIPEGTATGRAQVTILSENEEVSRAELEIRRIAPEIAQAGTFPNALVMRIRNGIRSFEPIVRITSGWAEPLPVDFGPPSDDLFLLLFGTGLRGRSSLSEVRAFADETELTVEYAGPQGEFAGLDQITIRLPRSLASGTSKFPFLTVLIDGMHLMNVDGDNLYLPIK